ncbi:hypothetical protein AGMMS50267_00210 [Spirochaetia bacterium]|nr:hypothetical protein AGMMS50267_00210 [Spirochaetia bacterium]
MVFLRLRPQKNLDKWAPYGVCRVKNRLEGRFFFIKLHEVQQTPSVEMRQAVISPQKAGIIQKRDIKTLPAPGTM